MILYCTTNISMNNTNKRKVIIISTALAIIIIVLFTINYKLSSTTTDNYSNYLKTTTEKSINLTKAYQSEIALWNSHFYTNITMAKITETFLPKFITQLNQFKNTDAPAKYSKVKENYVKSFASEIKSYQLFDDYLKTNNSTANKLSNENLTAALNYETIARNAFTQANNSSR
jgi:hypothetical protein